MSALGYATATMLISGLLFFVCSRLHPNAPSYEARAIVEWGIILTSPVWLVSTITAIILWSATL
jgi:hypothetical protein